MRMNEMRVRIGEATLAVAIALGLASRAAAQDELEEARDKKLKSEFLTKAAWITDFKKAREESRKSGRPIFGYFTRSYSP
jgi:hypothetical protein